MSDIHVLLRSKKGTQVVFHFVVPSIDNDVGKNYREILIVSGLGGTTKLPDSQITEEEKLLIESGEFQEMVTTINLESGGPSPQQRQVTLRDAYTKKTTQKLKELKSTLKFFGHEENI